MAETFTLQVLYKNKERSFDAELRVTGYTYRIVVTVDNREIVFERDEERNYRAILTEETEIRNLPDVELLKAIANELEIAFK